MPKYQFTVDNKNYEVNAPEGVSPEDAYQGLSEQLGAKPKTEEKKSSEISKQEEGLGDKALNIAAMPARIAVGAGEAALSLATGYAGSIAGGSEQAIAALYEGLRGKEKIPASPDAPKEFGKEVSESMTYEPRTEYGKKIMNAFGLMGIPFEYAATQIRNLEKGYKGQTVGSDIALGLLATLAPNVKAKAADIVRETKLAKSEQIRLGQKKETIDQLHQAAQMGFRFSPGAIEKATGVKTGLSKHEQTIGSAKIENQLSLHNQGVADNLARKNLEIPQDQPLSHENIDKRIEQLSKSAGYEQMRNLYQGMPIKLDDSFENSIRDAVKTESPLASDRKSLKAVQDEIVEDIDAGAAERLGAPGMLGTKTIKRGEQTASQLMNQISALRAKAAKLYKSAPTDQTGAFTRDKADAYVSASNAIENFLMKKAEAGYGEGSEIVNNFRDARTKIAQAYAWRELVDPEATAIDFNKLRSEKFDHSKKMLTGDLNTLRGLARAGHTRNMFKGMPQQREAGMSYLGTQAMIHWLGKTIAGAGGAGAGGGYIAGPTGAAVGAGVGAALTGGIEAARAYATSGRATRKALERGAAAKTGLEDKFRSVEKAANKHAKAVLALQQAERDREERRKKRMMERK